MIETNPTQTHSTNQGVKTDWTYVLSLAELAEFSGKKYSTLEKQLGSALFRLPGGLWGVEPDQSRAILEKKIVPFQQATIAHINLRGGIGKTTSAICLASRAAALGYRTVLIDLDPQASATLALDCLPNDDDPIFYDVWHKPDELVPISLKDVQPDFKVLPSSLENSLLDTSLLNPSSQKNAVRKVTEVLYEMGFELIVLDCPPSLGAGTISAICAADILVVPLGSDAFSFKGLQLTLTEVDSITDAFQMTRPEIRVLLSRYDRRERLSASALEHLENEYADLTMPLVIHTSSIFAKALEKKQTIYANHRKSVARNDYDRFVAEVLQFKAR